MHSVGDGQYTSNFGNSGGICFIRAVYIEMVFQWPGVGRMLVDAILKRDILLVQGGVVFVAACYVIFNIAVDVAQHLLDPRIKHDWVFEIIISQSFIPRWFSCHNSSHICSPSNTSLPLLTQMLLILKIDLKHLLLLTLFRDRPSWPRPYE